MSVLYLCDGKRCAFCSEECKHTSQIEHAVNFKEDASGNYWEREKGMTKDEPKHDRDWIIGCIKHDGFIETYRGDKANQIILEALEADTVEVVRCKDCKHAYKRKPINKTAVMCEMFAAGMKDNDFCSYGERREE